MSARVFHAELWGKREKKYAQLASSDVSTTTWSELPTAEPHYWFVPKDLRLQAEYDQGWSVTRIFGTGNPPSDQGKRWASGVKTNRDHLLIDFDRSILHQRTGVLAGRKLSDEEVKVRFGLADGRYWNTARERQKIRAANWEANIVPYLYRPFDLRWILYQPNLIEIHRGGASKFVMQHMVQCNLALLTMRQTVPYLPYSFAGVTRRLVDHGVFYLGNKGEGKAFPLYVCDHERRRANLAPEFVRQLGERVGLEFVEDGRGDFEDTFGPEDVFDYIYAVLHSPTYRNRYEEFLKIDFPRIPLTSDRELFRSLVALGGQLVALHLLEADIFKDPANFITSFPEPGSNVVERVRYDEVHERVYINKTQYFQGLPKEVWEFHVGGYQVLHKWLKDRGPKRGQPGRALTDDDITHYHKVVLALKQTIRAMAGIDAAIPSWPIQ